ncbi:hypothetical protein HBI56_149940 [Parastagonospora nodorum]|uniref:Uncharacterized protein n=1 Tax=Phaeosphaeria nodorum (strain SN15 / ATCC MYA-4574 / FGSC 10173) TaxID=321614 RepID=A0A7U2FF86_PHANO|nr:hypothetical protein HBH56_184590 [Parastagonospora nodorum]QRD04048.1 hypothetical protein JI435_420570 [Parastagonospora nodorum SN15]KAH3926070.1 hypothetical protein HBH54_173740 [Parastagonospora nodorum]KAH3944771.1 hypothetical protein HBH53_151200 [Parastagonospora nodorum]KAH3962417.1 hypothetical protein HBH52_225210 [Parastagonospora nodorum]
MTCIGAKTRLPIRLGVSCKVLHGNLCSVFGNIVWEPDVNVLGHVWEVVSSVLGSKAYRRSLVLVRITSRLDQAEQACHIATSFSLSTTCGHVTFECMVWTAELIHSEHRIVVVVIAVRSRWFGNVRVLELKHKD